jgi:hypothetical protein
MMYGKRLLMMCFVAGLTAVVSAQQRPVNQPPAGFTAIFNGKDLTGWRGRQPNYNPLTEAALPKAELDAKQAEWNAARDLHWKVDTAKGEIVSDGESPHLATVKNYGNFEMYVDWLMVSNNGDSGIYLRGYPQVQIWDPSNARELRNGADKGSGALWNNKPDNPGKFPLVKADNPIGSWNTLKIKMIGDRVWISMNDKVTVDGAVLDNYFSGRGPATPIVASGPIELQTHGSEIRFRNVFVREIPAAEAAATK